MDQISNLFPSLDPAVIQYALALVSVACAVLLVFWNVLFPDRLDKRIKDLDEERERIRKRERERLNGGKPIPLLARKPRPIYQLIVDQMNLAKRAEDGRIAIRLKQAGYRGRAPVIAYLASRLITPVLFFPVAWIYLGILLGGRFSPTVILLFAFVAGALGYLLPDLYLKNRITKRQQAISRAWPDTLDLLLLSVEAGMSIEAAFAKVAEEISLQSTEVAEELTLTTAELSYLQDRRQAFENLADRTGTETVRGIVTALIQAEKYGTSLGSALRVIARENRDMRMAEAEKKAAALPPRLTVPMIVFFLPVLFAVIMTPAIIQVLDSF